MACFQVFTAELLSSQVSAAQYKFAPLSSSHILISTLALELALETPLAVETLVLALACASTVYSTLA
jgi:hypothetical protein